MIQLHYIPLSLLLQSQIRLNRLTNRVFSLRALDIQLLRPLLGFNEDSLGVPDVPRFQRGERVLGGVDHQVIRFLVVRHRVAPQK